MAVLILSRNVAIYSTRRLTEAFRSRGRRVVVRDPASVTLRVGDDGPEIFSGGTPLPPPAVAVPRIGVVATDYAVTVLRQLEALGVPLTASADGVAAAKNKMTCLQTLAAAGLPVPKTVIARQAPDEEWTVGAVGGPPVVLKFPTGTHGVGVMLADSEEAAKTILESMWGVDRNLLVQEYVAAAAGRDLRLFVVGDRVVAAIRRIARPGRLRSNLHHGGRAEAFPPDQALAGLAIRAASAMGLRVAGVDLLESDRGPLIAEVNCSPGLEGIEEATGIDVAAAVADEALRIARTA
jgi:ribosomal protein S6--L-glutamate ligase